MGIYIKKLKAPDTCRDCFRFATCRYGDKLLQCRADECPIVEIPIPHGRLIDADWLLNFEHTYCMEDENDEESFEMKVILSDVVRELPTVIDKEE